MTSKCENVKMFSVNFEGNVIFSPHRQKSVTFEPANVKSGGIFNLAAKKSNAKCTKKMYEE